MLDLAHAFSPRVEREGDAVLLDVSGLGRIIGDPPAVGRELAREARVRGLDVVAAIAATRTAARLLAHARQAVVIPAGEERAAVAPLPVTVLPAVGLAEHLPTLGRWGLRTLGEVAALSPPDIHARLGGSGVALHRVACGRDDRPLAPSVDPARFEASMDLEWPIDALEPLSFVLARLLEPLSAALERADRGASAIVLTLTLTTRDAMTRRLELPAPMRDARTLRTLLLLLLEAQPVAEAIDRVAILLEPTPGRIVQYSLLERARPSPETLSTLVARLEALMGAGRVGSPAPVDSHEPGAFELAPFHPEARGQGPGAGRRCSTDSGPPASGPRPPASVLRRFRLPVPARVDLERGRPARVATGRRGLAGGRVIECAGPWRASGGWWSHAHKEKRERSSAEVRSTNAEVNKWNKDEWDVALPDGVYRIYQDRDASQWFLEGILD